MITAILIRPSGSVTTREFKGFRDAMKLLGYSGEKDNLGYVHKGPHELTGCESSSLLCRTAEMEKRKKHKPNPVAGFLCGSKLVGPALLFGWDPEQSEVAAHTSVASPGETSRYIRGTIRHLATGADGTDDERQDCVWQAIGHLGAWRAGDVTIEELHSTQFAPQTMWDKGVDLARSAALRAPGQEPNMLFARGLTTSLSMLNATRDGFALPAQSFAQLLEFVDEDTAKASSVLHECCKLTTAASLTFGGPSTEGADGHTFDFIASLAGHLMAGDEGIEKLFAMIDRVTSTETVKGELDSWANALRSAITEWDAA